MSAEHTQIEASVDATQEVARGDALFKIEAVEQLLRFAIMAPILVGRKTLRFHRYVGAWYGTQVWRLYKFHLLLLQRQLPFLQQRTTTRMSPLKAQFRDPMVCPVNRPLSM